MMRMDSIELEISNPRRKYFKTTKLAGLFGLAGAKKLDTKTDIFFVVCLGLIN